MFLLYMTRNCIKQQLIKSGMFRLTKFHLKERIILYVLYIILPFILNDCTYEFPFEEPFVPEKGSVDFTKVVAIGSSYAAGYMDGALYSSGQANSFPAIIARQISRLEMSEFNQPDIDSEYGYNEIESEDTVIRGKYYYTYPFSSSSSPDRETYEGEFPEIFSGEKSELNNFAVPGTRIFQVNRSQLSNNIYYERFASEPGVSTLLEDAINTNPTFFILFLGLEDILSYALSGGTGDIDPASDPDQISEIDMTPVELFESSYELIINELFNNPSIKGVIANIPDVTDFLYFSDIPPNIVRLVISDYFYDDFDFLYDFYRDFNTAVTYHNWISPDEIQRPHI